MQFKELKPNYTIYVFDKGNMTCEEAKIVSTSVPRFDSKMGQTPGMVVDVTIEHNGKNMTYVFPSDTSKAYNGNCTFCINKVDIISDIKAIQRASEQIISEVDKHKGIIAKCGELLANLDTEEKAKQEMESRLSKMETRFDNIETLLKQIASK